MFDDITALAIFFIVSMATVAGVLFIAFGKDISGRTPIPPAPPPPRPKE